MFDFEAEAINKKGFIEVEFKKKLKKFGGKTVADGSALSSIFGFRYFTENEWDYVLEKLSSFNLGLQLAENIS